MSSAPKNGPEAKPTTPRRQHRSGCAGPWNEPTHGFTNYGQLRRNTDRRTKHRLAQLAFAIALIITIKLIDWRNRWSPTN